MRTPGGTAISSQLSADAPLRFGANHTPAKHWMHSWLSLDLDDVRRDFASLAALGLDHVRLFPLWTALQPNRTLIREQAVADVQAWVDACAGGADPAFVTSTTATDAEALAAGGITDLIRPGAGEATEYSSQNTVVG